MHYKHLNISERESIYFYIKNWYSIREVWRILQRSHSTISREIKRNSTCISPRHQNWSYKKIKEYLPDKADIKYKKRNKESKYRYPLKSYFINRFVIKNLKKWYSPDIISGILKTKYCEYISHECIYQFIYSKRWRELELYKYLLRHHKKRKAHKLIYWKKSKIPGRVDIDLRPEIVNENIEIWHLEADTILSKWRNSCIVTLIDRYTKKSFIWLVNSLKSNDVINKINELLSDYKPYIKTITFDNWSEFTYHQNIKTKLWIDTYFAKPYSPRQRWMNENFNWILRRYLPKWTNFLDINNNLVAKIENIINNRPRKILNYETPNNVFMSIVKQN